MNSPTHLLLQSLVEGPLLIGDLPEAASFPRHQLQLPTEHPPLNLRQKLGHLYEDALAFLIEASPRFEILARNLQLQSDDQTTLGELDFLLRDLEDDQLVHLELATKFYLAVDTPSGPALPGPDARDNYFRKLQRLRSHQLPLARNHHCVLPKAYQHQPIVSRQLIYGCLFHHIHAPQPAAPDFANPRCRRGRWLLINECQDYFAPGTRLQLIPKALWPVPLPLLNEIALKPWSPENPIERGQMLRVSDHPIPYFVTPPNYLSTITPTT